MLPRTDSSPMGNNSKVAEPLSCQMEISLLKMKHVKYALLGCTRKAVPDGLSPSTVQLFLESVWGALSFQNGNSGKNILSEAETGE